ncbi:MAG TPA: FAD-binding oxidoreductase [Kofleriaceae bacterium]|nr:FAD-binding oxidoreductase [Kofleriaceae bacterium]
MSASAEIVIIGGGVIGASTAYHLAAKGATSVMLLERGGLASGETGKSGGFIQTHWDSLDEVRLIARSRDVFARWRDEIGGDCGFVRGGYLHVTGVERLAGVRAVHDMLVREGLESQWLDPEQLSSLQPLLHVEDLAGGAWEPASGWANPLAATRSLAEAARRRGVALREDTRVVRIVHDHGRVTGVETEAGVIACRVAILAAGPWTPRLHALPEVPLPITLRRGQVCYLDRPSGFPRREIGFYDEITGLYTHPSGDTNFVGIDYKLGEVQDPDDYVRTVDADYCTALLGKLAVRFPPLAPSRIVRGVVGLYDFTPDGQPIVDAMPGLAGYYVAAGFSGVGFKSAPATGLGLAELVLDGKPSSVAIDHLALARFSAQPPAGISPELIAKLSAVRELLSVDEQARLIPYVMTLAPDQLAAFAALLVTRSPAELAAELRARLA